MLLFYVNVVLFYFTPVLATLIMYSQILREVRKLNAEMEKYLFHDRSQNQGNSSGKFVGAKYTVRYSDDSLDQSASTVLTRVSGFPSRSENAQTSVPRMQLVGMGGTTKQDNGTSFQIQRLQKFKQVKKHHR